MHIILPPSTAILLHNEYAHEIRNEIKMEMTKNVTQIMKRTTMNGATNSREEPILARNEKKRRRVKNCETSNAKKEHMYYTEQKNAVDVETW